MGIRENWRKGIKKERRIAKRARDDGLIAIRSGGSQGPIDLVIIDPKLKRIRLLQCKPEDYTGADKLIEENIELNGTFDVEFEVV